MKTSDLQATVDRTWSGFTAFLAKWLWSPALANPKTAAGVLIGAVLVIGFRVWKLL